MKIKVKVARINMELHSYRIRAETLTLKLENAKKSLRRKEGNVWIRQKMTILSRQRDLNVQFVPILTFVQIAFKQRTILTL